MKQYIVYSHLNKITNKLFFLNHEYRYIKVAEDFFIPQCPIWIGYMKYHSLTFNDIECKTLYRGIYLREATIFYNEFIMNYDKKTDFLLPKRIISTNKHFFKKILYWSEKLQQGGEELTIKEVSKKLSIDASRISRIASHYYKTGERLYSKTYTFEYIL